MNEPHDSKSERGTLPGTPALDRLLGDVRAGLTRLVWMHGIGTAVAVACAWLLFAFLSDWFLHLPAALRLLNLAVLFGLPGFFLWRELIRPLAQRPDRTGLAVLVERAHPGQRELIVSAAELSTARAPSGDKDFIARVLRDADQRAGELSASRALDARRPTRRLAGGILALLGLALVFAFNAPAAGVFLQRIAGGSTAWPQRTHLTLEIPLSAVDGSAPSAPTERGELVVRVARGSDVPIIVHALGEEPEEVVLHFDGGHRSVLGSSGQGAFRTVLRSLQEDVAFFATGGDDEDEDPRARLVVLQPPDVAGIAVSIHPPAYTHLPDRVEFDRDVEVLAGTHLVLHVLPDPPSAHGKARLLPEDRVVDLVRAPFPAKPNEAAKAPVDGLAFEITPDKNLRWRAELVDDRGLSNPDPGLFGVTVVEDHAPEVEVLSPGRSEVDTVPGGLLALRARAEDDFAISRMTYDVVPAGAENAVGTARDLEWRVLTPEERAAADEHAGRGAVPARNAHAVAFGRARIEVALLAEKDAPPAAEGQQYQLVVRALDNSEPKAHEGRSGQLRVRITAPDEFLRRVQDRLARAQATTTTLAELQRDKQRRTREVLAALESDAPALESAQPDIAAALTGERRVQGDARSLARELCSAAEAVLYARVDDRAGAALEQIDKALSASLERSFDAAPWRELAAEGRRTQIAGTALAGKLVEIAGLSLEISEDSTNDAVVNLQHAQEAADPARAHAALTAAADAETKALERLDHLLERLAEWDNFQSVLGLTRDILNGQKSLEDRTRQAAKDK